MKLRGVPGGAHPAVQWLLVLLCVLIVALAAMLVRRERGMADTIASLREQLGQAAQRVGSLEREAARERAARQAFEIGLDRERESKAQPGIALQPGLSADGRPSQQIRIPPDSSGVQLVVPLPARRFSRYRAAIRAWSGGEAIWSHAALRPAGDRRRLFVAVPGDVLEPGAYELALSGIRPDGSREDLSSFTFEVQR